MERKNLRFLKKVLKERIVLVNRMFKPKSVIWKPMVLQLIIYTNTDFDLF